MADKKPYLIVNLVLAGLIGLIFIYSLVFPPAQDNHPIPSFFEKITGMGSPSAGMSHAFSKMIRGNLQQAGEYNPDGPLIFAFFLIQGIQRISVSLILLKWGKTSGQVREGSLPSGKGLPPEQEKRLSSVKKLSSGNRPSSRPNASQYLLIADATLSLVLFFYCFYGQILAMVRLLINIEV